MEVRKIIRGDVSEKLRRSYDVNLQVLVLNLQIISQNLQFSAFPVRFQHDLVVLPVNLAMQRARQNGINMKRETTRRHISEPCSHKS